MHSAAHVDIEGLRAGIHRWFLQHQRVEAPAFDVLTPHGVTSHMGVVMLIHGGAWYLNGREYMDQMLDAAERWCSRGWVAVNIDYRPCADSLPDTLGFHDGVRDSVGHGCRLGLHGSSAGGHLALMTAVERDGIAFVVGEAAPTDLVLLGGNARADDVRDRAIQAFGGDALERLSPARRAAEIDANVLLATCSEDEQVPADQMRHMYDALPARTQTMVLPPGGARFIHADVDAREIVRFHAAEAAVAQL